MQNQIPNNWQKIKLGEVLEMKYGRGLTEKNRQEGDIPVYGSSGIIGYNKDAFIQTTGIIIGRKGNVGSVYFSSSSFYPIDTVYYVDSLKKQGDLKFFYYLLQRIPFKRIGSDVGVPGLNRDMAYGLDVIIPDDENEQKRIASILSSFDDKIELNNKIAKTLEGMAQAIFKEWFVRSKNNNWREGILGQLISVKHGFAFPSNKFKKEGDIPVIKIKNIKEDNSINLNDMEFVNLDDFKSLENFKLINGDILVALTGATTGKIGLLIGNYSSYLLNQRVGKIQPMKSYYKWFVYVFLTRQIYRDLLLGFADGSAQGNLSPSQIENIKLIIPSDDFLLKFDEVINSFYQKIFSVKLENQKLTELRDLLLPKLMKGEIRV